MGWFGTGKFGGKGRTIMFLRSAAAGEYEPAYFIIRIDADQPPEELLQKNESTFFHEYIHLLQDLVLPYCMRENMVRMETFFVLIQQARQSGEMRLPSEASGADVDLTKRIAATTWGASSFHRGVAAIHQIDMIEESVDGKEYRLQKYILSGDNVSNYHFGARDLLEYIASKIELRHFPGEFTPPDLPYRSVDLVLEHKGLSYLSDVKRVALAEYCLSNDNPARRMMMIIEDILQGSFKEKDRGDDDAFVDHLISLDWTARGVPFRTIADKLSKRYSELRETLQNQFHPDAFPAIYAWLDGALTYAKEALSGRGLFAALYSMETEEFHFAIHKILDRVGIPLVQNRGHSLGTSLGGETSKDQFIQLLLAYEFPEYLKRDETTCPLYSRCQTDAPALIDEIDCIEAPFRRAKRKKLCPFGVFVKATGLAQVRWYTRDRLISSFRSDPFAPLDEDEDDE
jgi:hypothetical protein